MLKSAVRKYCLVQATSFNDFKEEYELEADFVLTGKVNLILADPANNTRSAGASVQLCSRLVLEEKYEGWGGTNGQHDVSWGVRA